MHVLRTALAYVIVATLFWIVFGLAVNAQGGARWYHYTAREGSAPVLVAKARCISAEDSASHLRVIAYDPSRIVLGCARHGY